MFPDIAKCLFGSKITLIENCGSRVWIWAQNNHLNQKQSPQVRGVYHKHLGYWCLWKHCRLFNYHKWMSFLISAIKGLISSIMDAKLDTLTKWIVFKISKLAEYFYTHTLLSEKAMATHSSPLAWKIPWMEEPGGLQSMGSRRVGHDWATSLSLFPFMHWRRKWWSTPVFLPGESQGQGSLVGCRPWGHTE